MNSLATQPTIPVISFGQPHDSIRSLMLFKPVPLICGNVQLLNVTCTALESKDLYIEGCRAH